LRALSDDRVNRAHGERCGAQEGPQAQLGDRPHRNAPLRQAPPRSERTPVAAFARGATKGSRDRLVAWSFKESLWAVEGFSGGGQPGRTASRGPPMRDLKAVGRSEAAASLAQRRSGTRASVRSRGRRGGEGRGALLRAGRKS